jgi:ABC-type polar amino acid transport system ATPase subunit
MTTNAVLTIDDVALRREKREVLRGVSFTVAASEVVALMGVSGAGKSTLLRSIAALERLDAGRIVVGSHTLLPGAVPKEHALRSLRQQVGMVFQQHALFSHLTVLQNVTLAPVHVTGTPLATAAARASALLESLGVAHRAEAYPSAISGGEAQRVAIARALALDPQLLLMDEPTAALDPARRGALAETVRELARAGRGLLITTHDIDFAKEAADRVIVLAEGMVAEIGPARRVLDTPTHDATRALLR